MSIGSIRFTGPTVRYMNAIKGGDRGSDRDELVAENLKFNKVTFTGGLLQMLPPLCFEELRHTNSAIVSEGGSSPLAIEDSNVKGAVAQSSGGVVAKQEALDKKPAKRTKTAKTLKSDDCKNQKVKPEPKM